jgi:hypothetical protein
MSNGNVAYLAYVMKVGGKSVHGEDLPWWHELPDELRDAWETAAEAAIVWQRDGIVTLQS